ncbi:PREDICTED: uncharacterized protein LOC108767925 [Trachymyrmex cornetzi]|uniref:uncharacterized protein LOC108767925 n=1 Tax=Trachymyrmex cornetzi TaxID=471704 RepID=UPI00084F5C5C|nr:PREDICTED: uncharacterized protein LOC108767925 [Trachymyrmex cornetzi]
MFYNYKGQYSVVLLAMVDAHLRFIYVDVGTNGRVSDSGVWNKCSLKNYLDRGTLNIPPPAPLPDTQDNFPYVIIGDEGFPLSEKLLIPYPGPQCNGNIHKRIYNYRLSRAQRCSENAFSVMAARFQIFRSAMRYDPDDAFHQGGNRHPNQAIALRDRWCNYFNTIGAVPWQERMIR